MAAGSGTSQRGPGGTSDRAQVLAAIKKWGPSVDAMARKRYGISGEALLAKLAEGESGAISNPGAAKGKVSSAGARAWTQFTAGSRAEAIKRFGIDPWASPDQAFHATVLHLEGKINGSTGLEGYNPGMPTYKDYILGQKVGDVHGAARSARGPAGSSSAGGVGGAGAAVPTQDTGLSQAFEAGRGTLSSLLQTAAPAPMPQGSLPQMPSFAAGPSLPQGYAPPPSGGGPQPAPQVQLPTASDLSLPDVAQQTTPDGAAPADSPVGALGGATSKGRGKVKVAAGANRAGVGLQKPILGFLDALSAQMGREVDVTTGTNHNRMTTTGNVSDHWDGNATDLGVGGDARQDTRVAKKGDLIAAHAIQLAGGVSWGKALRMAEKGGVFNFETKQGRVQILWRTEVGGNHYNHVHIGLNPGR